MEKRIDWGLVKGWIENNWTFQEGSVICNPDNIDEMAIGISGNIDNYIRLLIKRRVDLLKEKVKDIDYRQSKEDILTTTNYLIDKTFEDE